MFTAFQVMTVLLAFGMMIISLISLVVAIIKITKK